MPVMKLKQLQYENETWKRLLGFMTDENVHMKNRVSEVLVNSTDKSLLEQLEVFLNRFIKEDERIGLLRNQAAELDKLLVKELFEDGRTMKEAVAKLERIRGNIKTAEKQFASLKVEFNNFLLSII
jgi:hypothetical protein